MPFWLAYGLLFLAAYGSLEGGGTAYGFAPGAGDLESLEDLLPKSDAFLASRSPSLSLFLSPNGIVAVSLLFGRKNCGGCVRGRTTNGGGGEEVS